MRGSKLRWLSLLALIGIAGFFTGNHGFFGFFGFGGFLAFRRVDERDTTNLARAGLASFVSTMILCAAAIATIPTLGQYRVALSLDVGDLFATSILWIAGIFLANLLSFEISYHYYDVTGR